MMEKQAISGKEIVGKIWLALRAVLWVILISSIIYLLWLKYDAGSVIGGSQPTLVFVESPSCTVTCPAIRQQAMEFAEKIDLRFKNLSTIGDYEVPLVYVISGETMTEIVAIGTDAELGDFLCAQLGTEAACERAPVPKKDVPDVKLFVMSLCPYGLQIEKGLVPVLEALGDSVEFNLLFVDYAMHGERELHENMMQHCIRSFYPNELLRYLDCFTTLGNTKYCVSTINVNTTMIEGCFDNTEDRFHIIKEAKNATGYPKFPIDSALVQRYGVKGSPVLVVNGQVASTERDPASLLRTICDGFTTKPEACNSQLSSAIPNPGIGTGTSNTTAQAGCGN